jgi:hypothetical protein
MSVGLDREGRCPKCGRMVQSTVSWVHSPDFKNTLEENQMKICKWCGNYFNGWCKLNPVAVAKDSDDTCSHWAPKVVNEFKGCCGMVK